MSHPGTIERLEYGRLQEDCPCPDCRAWRENHPTAKGVAKAERLLRRFLTDEQVADWEADQTITVIGSAGGLFRLTPRLATLHHSVARSDGLGVSVWPRGLEIAADWALALMLLLQADEPAVVNAGCHARVDPWGKPERPWEEPLDELLGERLRVMRERQRAMRFLPEDPDFPF